MGLNYCILLDNGMDYSDYGTIGYALVDCDEWERVGTDWMTDEWELLKRKDCEDFRMKNPKGFCYPEDERLLVLFGELLTSKGVKAKVSAFDEYFSLRHY